MNGLHLTQFKVISTLLGNGFSADDLGLKSLDIVTDFLQRQLAAQNGIVGFGKRNSPVCEPRVSLNASVEIAPKMLPDADDTAKTVLCLNMLGRPVSPILMITTFQSENHFKTYDAERTASLSTNCNVLNALLHTASPSTYLREISDAAHFLCDSWSNGLVKDKWVRANVESILKLLFY